MHGDEDEHRGGQGADDGERNDWPCAMDAGSGDCLEDERETGRVPAYVDAVAAEVLDECPEERCPGWGLGEIRVVLGRVGCAVEEAVAAVE